MRERERAREKKRERLTHGRKFVDRDFKPKYKQATDKDDLCVATLGVCVRRMGSF